MAFGCSFSAYTWTTVTELIGHQFDKFVLIAQPGASNPWIAQRFWEAVIQLKLEPSRDHIIIQSTGLGRFAAFDLKQDRWDTRGDILTVDPVNRSSDFLMPETAVFNHRLAVYQTWVALTSVVEYLKARGFDWTFIPGADFFELSHHLKEHDLAEILALETKLGTRHRYLRDWTLDRPSRTTDDGHPTPQEARDYILECLPEFGGPALDRALAQLSDPEQRQKWQTKIRRGANSLWFSGSPPRC